MKYIGFQLLNITGLKSTTSHGIELLFTKFQASGHRSIAVVDMLVSWGRKDWAVNLMLLGLWVSCALEQPEWEEGEELEVAKREWRWGFNYFQKVEAP